VLGRADAHPGRRRCNCGIGPSHKAEGGCLAFEEVNVRSPEARAKRAYWRLQNLYREKKFRFVEMDFGLDHIVNFHDEELFWRQVESRRFVKRMERQGLRLVGQRAGMFTEAHLSLPRSLQGPMNAWNRFFHKSIGISALSKHVIYIFQRSGNPMDS
jgi:hypothetical protein